MQGPLLAGRVVDIVLQLHNTAGTIGRHQLGTTLGDKSGLLGADLLTGIVMIDRIGAAQTTAGSGRFHFDVLNLRQRLKDLPWLFGDAPGAQMTGVMIGHPLAHGGLG